MARLAVVTAAVAFATSACVGEDSVLSSPVPGTDASANAPSPATSAAVDYRAYVIASMDAMEAYFWNAGAVDWRAIRAATVDSLTEPVTQAEAHAELADAVRAFDTSHSSFVPPGDGSSGSGADKSLPAGERHGAIGYVALPSISDPGAFRPYLRAAHSAMADADEGDSVCGWVIDIRDNIGGNLGPMLQAVGGLLGTGRVLTAYTGTHESWVDVAERGELTFGGAEAIFDDLDDRFISRSVFSQVEIATIEEAYAAEPPYVPGNPMVPVVVLTSNRTASAAEVLAIAFLGRQSTELVGQPTFGIPTGVTGFRMVDGAILRLATTTFADRTGEHHTGNLIPDVAVADTRAVGTDAILSAGIETLEGYPGCA